MESPPVATGATGRALILVNEDGTISGVIEAPGIADATAVIKDDTADADAPVVFMLVPVGDGMWEVPRGTRLTPLPAPPAGDPAGVRGRDAPAHMIARTTTCVR